MKWNVLGFSRLPIKASQDAESCGPPLKATSSFRVLGALALRGFAGLGDLLDGPLRISTEGGGRGMPGKCGVADGVARLGSASKH